MIYPIVRWFPYARFLRMGAGCNYRCSSRMTWAKEFVATLLHNSNLVTFSANLRSTISAGIMLGEGVED